MKSFTVWGNEEKRLICFFEFDFVFQRTTIYSTLEEIFRFQTLSHCYSRKKHKHYYRD